MMSTERIFEKEIISKFQLIQDKKLSILIDNVEGQDGQILSSVESQLACQSLLEELSITIAQTCILFKDGYFQIMNAILKLIHLKKISLNISNLCFLEDEGLLVIIEAVSQITNIEDFELNIENNNYIHLNSLEILLNSLQNLIKLKKLTLKLKDISHSHLQNNIQLFSNLKYVKNIKELSFSLDVQNLSESDMISFAFNLCLFKQLDSLKIEFIKNDSRFYWIEVLQESLKQIKNIKMLFINFDHSERLTNSQLLSFCLFIRHFQDLEKFGICCLNILQREENFATFIESISHLKNLKELDFNLGMQITNSMIDKCYFGKSLSYLTKLETLSIKQQQDLKICDQFFFEFSKALQSLEKLSFLQLDLLTYISEFGFDIFTSSLKNLQQLEKLQLILNVNFYQQKTILERINHLINLKFLKILFKDHQKIYLSNPLNNWHSNLFNNLTKLNFLEILFIGKFKGNDRRMLDLDTFLQHSHHLSNLTHLSLDISQRFPLQKTPNLNEFASLRNLLFLDLKFSKNVLECSLLYEHFKFFTNLKTLKLTQINWIAKQFHQLPYYIFHLQSLEHFSIKLYQTDSQFIKKLLFSIGNIKTLQELELSYGMDRDDKIDELTQIFTNLENLKKLKIIDKTYCQDLIGYYSEGISELYNLQDLQLLCEFSIVTEQGAKKFENFIQKLNRLQFLKMKSRCIETQDGVNYICEGFSHLKYLKELNFQFKIIYENILRIKIKNLKELPFLTNIGGYFMYQNQYGYQFLKESNTINREIDLLQNWENDYETCFDSQIKENRIYKQIQVFSDPFLNMFAQQCSNFNKLRILNLILSEFSITDSKEKQLEEGMKYLTNLEQLYIKGNLIQESGISLLKGLKHLSSLQNFSLKKSKVSLDNFTELINSVKNLVQLHSLNIELEIQDQNQTIDSQIIQFGECLVSLNILELMIEGITPIKDEAVISLGKGFQHLKKLEYFSLLLENNKKIETIVQRSLITSLRNSYFLKNYKINITLNKLNGRYIIHELLNCLMQFQYLSEVEVIIKSIDYISFPSDIRNLKIIKSKEEQQIEFKFFILNNEYSLNFNNLVISYTFENENIEIDSLEVLENLQNEWRMNIYIDSSSQFKNQENRDKIFLAFKKISTKNLTVMIRGYAIPNEETASMLFEIFPHWQQLEQLSLSLWFDNKITKNNILDLAEKLSQLKNLRSLILEINQQNDLEMIDYANLIKLIGINLKLYQFSLQSFLRSIQKAIINKIKTNMKFLVVTQQSFDGSILSLCSV